MVLLTVQPALAHSVALVEVAGLHLNVSVQEVIQATAVWPVTGAPAGINLDVVGAVMSTNTVELPA